jgi:membrane protein
MPEIRNAERPRALGVNPPLTASAGPWIWLVEGNGEPMVETGPLHVAPALRDLGRACAKLRRHSVSRIRLMWSVLTTAADDWLRHRDARLGAALAYYSVFSLGPLLLIVVSIAGLFFGGEAVNSAITGQFRDLLGPLGSQAVEAMLKGAQSSDKGLLSAVVGSVLLAVAALGIVVQLKDALNTIWETREPESAGLWSYLRTYLISFAGVMGLGFLLAVSLVVSTALTAVSTRLGLTESLLSQFANLVVSLGVLAALFALMFRWFPDAPVAWRDALLGGLMTSVLFNAGKGVISWYIGSQGLDSTYGAAASIVVLLVWVYYTSQIVLFGAEVTHALGKVHPQITDANMAAAGG